MVKVAIEVSGGATRFCVTVQAESIERAVNLVAERYPTGDGQVKFPIDPEAFFVKDAAARPQMVGLAQLDLTAA